MDMLRGRGGTAGLPLFGGIDWASSELESSWPAVDKLTTNKIKNLTIQKK